MLMVPVLWLALSLAGPVVTVEGDSTCPTPAAVAAELSDLLPGAASALLPDLASLDDETDTIRIQVRRADGTPIGERRLERTFPCADLAAAVAVIIATWESDVHPEFRVPLPAPSPMQGPPPSTSVGAIVVAAPPAPAGKSASAAYDVGAALTGALAPSSGDAGAAVGALAVASWTPTGGRLGGRLVLQADSERTLALGAAPSAVLWRRARAGLGPQLRLTSSGRGVFFDLHADALVAWVMATGSKFPTSQSSNGFDFGVGLGGRLMLPGRALAPWVDLTACGWLRPQVAYELPNQASSVTLPRFEAILALGLSFCACP